MKMEKWPYVLLFIFLYEGNFLFINGESLMPKWSEQVETKLRFIPTDAPEIIEATIYFDKKRNALAIVMEDVSEEAKLGGERLLIYHFDKDERMSIIGHKCDPTESINRSSNSIQFVKTTHEGETLKDFGSLFFFDPINYATQVPYNWSETYDVETTKWESTFVIIEGFSFDYCNLTHYITIPAPEGERGENYFSNIVKIEGFCLLQQNSNEEAQNNVHFVVNILESKNYISNAEIFQQPPGVYCSFVNTSRNFPSMPPYFSFNFVTFDSDNELGDHLSVVNFRKKIWYDSSHMLLRKDNLDWDFDVTVTMVGDYSSRISYIIYPYGNCIINELKDSDTMENGITLPGENFPLFPRLTANNIPQYVGERIRYGVTFDVWVNRNEYPDTIEISDYYFTNNVISEDNRNMTSPAFIEIFIFNSDEMLVGSALQIIGEYRTKRNMQDQSTFDVTRCFPENNKTRFSLTFTGKDNNLLIIDQQGLVNTVRRKLLDSIDVSSMRLGAVEISFLDESSVVFSSVLVEDPIKLGYKQGTEETSREEALKTLSGLVNETKLLISVDAVEIPQQKITLTATKLMFPYSQENGNKGDDKNKDKSKDKNKDPKKHTGGFSSGALAGVGIAMLAVGMFQGIILLVAYIRYRRNDPLVRRLTASEEIPAPKPE